MIHLQELKLVFGQKYGRRRRKEGQTDRRGSFNSYLDGIDFSLALLCYSHLRIITNPLKTAIGNLLGSIGKHNRAATVENHIFEFYNSATKSCLMDEG